MSKKGFAGFLGAIVVAGVAVGALKYLKDYGGAKYLDKEKIDSMRSDSEKVKTAAKRTYTVIKDKSDVGAVKEAVGDLAKAAGETAVSAGDVAVSMGTEAINAAKGIKSKFDEDPEQSKEEMISNLKDMGKDISDKAASYGQSLKDKTLETVARVKDYISPDASSDTAHDESEEKPQDEEYAVGEASDPKEHMEEESTDHDGSDWSDEDKGHEGDGETKEDKGHKEDEISGGDKGPGEEGLEGTKDGPSFIEITGEE